MATVLITGGTGFIGTALTKALLDAGYDVIILTRNRSAIPNPSGRARYAMWNIQEQTIDKEAISKADHIIHLAGANVGEKRWTEKRKKEILESRTKSSELIIKALKDYPHNIKTVVTASGISWYGPDPNPSPRSGKGDNNSFVETDPAYDDFLGTTCQQWEENIESVTSLGIRLIKLRTGIVLGNEGGALKEFKKPLRFGIATILGNGKQIMSWIHIDDLVRLYIYALENEKMNGVYNAVAPHPVSNKTLILRLAKISRGKFFIPIYVPSFILEIVLGEMSIEVLKSATVSCEKIKEAGFIFLHPGITSAIRKQGAS